MEQHVAENFKASTGNEPNGLPQSIHNLSCTFAMLGASPWLNTLSCGHCECWVDMRSCRALCRGQEYISLASRCEIMSEVRITAQAEAAERAERDRVAAEERGPAPEPARSFRLPQQLVPDLLVLWELLQTLAPTLQVHLHS